MLTRAVPLLLVFSLVLFINTEMWQVFSLMPRAYLAAVAGLLALVAAAFLVGRLPREVVRLQGDGPAAEPRASASTSASSCSSRRRCRCSSSAPRWRASSSSSER